MSLTEQQPSRSLNLVVSSVAPSVKACCHTTTNGGAGPEAPAVALVGAPNTGKSTLFNALTGARVTMGNWPGTTVEVSRGVWKTTRSAASCTCEECTCEPGEKRLEITLIDLPGAYSLDPHSPDEALTPRPARRRSGCGTARPLRRGLRRVPAGEQPLHGVPAS